MKKNQKSGPFSWTLACAFLNPARTAPPRHGSVFGISTTQVSPRGSGAEGRVIPDVFSIFKHGQTDCAFLISVRLLSILLLSFALLRSSLQQG